MSQDEFRQGFGELWHWTVPPLNSMACAGYLVQSKLESPTFTDAQARMLEVIANIARRVRENWSYVFEDFISARDFSQEMVLWLCSTWWNYEARLLDKASAAIDGLLLETFGELNLSDDAREALKIVQHSCHLAADDWQHGKDYLLTWCGIQNEWKWESVSLPDAVNGALDYVGASYGIDNVDVTMPKNPPSVKGNHWLKRALINILSCVDSHTLNGYLFGDHSVIYQIRRDYRPTIAIELENDSATVCITVGLATEKGREERPLDSRLFSLGTRLSVVGSILERYDGRARFRWSDQCSEFRFAATFWEKD